MSDPYAELELLAAEQLRLIRAEDVEGLEALVTRRSELVAELPPQPPPAARAALARALELERESEQELIAAMRSTGGAVRKLQRGGAATAGYAQPAPQRLSTVDTLG